GSEGVNAVVSACRRPKAAEIPDIRPYVDEHSPTCGQSRHPPRQRQFVKAEPRNLLMHRIALGEMMQGYRRQCELRGLQSIRPMFSGVRVEIHFLPQPERP